MTRPLINSRLVPMALFTAAFVVMAPQIPTGQLGAGFESLTIARSLAEHGTFADPYSLYATGPTAHMAPLHSFFLALLIRLFGYSAIFALAVSICTLTAQGLQMALLPYVSELFFATRWPGAVGACLGIALPIFRFLPHSENTYCAVGLMLFCLTSHRLARSGSSFHALVCGVFLSVLVLLNPAALSVAVCWLAFLMWQKRVAAPMKFALVFAAAFVLVQAPWTWRNYRALHSFIFVRDNLGLELAVSNNDQAGPSFNWNWSHGVYFPLHPGYSAQEAERVRTMGEGAYVKARMAQAVQWIRTHPARFLELTAQRCRLFWFPTTEDVTPAFTMSIAFLTIGSWTSVLLLALRRQPIAAFFGAVLLLYPLVYYVVEFDQRYRVSILWLMLTATGYLLFLTARAFATLRDPARSYPLPGANGIT